MRLGDSLHIDAMMAVCFDLGRAAARQEAKPDLSMIETLEWQTSYMRGFDRGLRELRRERKAARARSK